MGTKKPKCCVSASLCVHLSVDEGGVWWKVGTGSIRFPFCPFCGTANPTPALGVVMPLPPEKR
jgi:hypothetical protein